MKNNTIIIGGGIVGKTLAIMLAQAKCPVTLIDAKASLNEQQWQDKLNKRDARVYALNLASIKLLKQVDAWQHIKDLQRYVDYTQMQVWQTNGVGELKFADEGSADMLGSMVEPSVIEYALEKSCQQSNVEKYLTLQQGIAVKELQWRYDDSHETAGYDVLMEDGSSYYAELLIGADGRQSLVRQSAGIELDYLDYKQTAICCAIRTEKPHQATARQAMLPTGSLALLPLADINDTDKKAPNHWQSVVWTLPTNQALDVLELGENTLIEDLVFASGYELGEIKQIESIASFELNAQQAKTYIKDNLALIGDAAHGVHPLAGQGLNLGMLDVQCLYEVLLADYQRSGYQQWAQRQTLQKYQRLRKANNSNMMHSFSILNWMFAGEFAQIRPWQYIRSEGVSMVSKSKLLMSFFAKQASGV